MIIGYQVQDQHGNNWNDRPSYEILTGTTASKELNLARNKYPELIFLYVRGDFHLGCSG